MTIEPGARHKANTGAGRDGKGRFLPGQTPRGARPWKPGQSGNPKGRPPRLTITDALAGVVASPASVNWALARAARALGLNPDTATVREVIVLTTLVRAVAGDAALLQMVWDRLDGKVAYRIAGPDDGPIQIETQRILSLVLLNPAAMGKAKELANMLTGDGEKGGAE